MRPQPATVTLLPVTSKPVLINTDIEQYEATPTCCGKADGSVDAQVNLCCCLDQGKVRLLPNTRDGRCGQDFLGTQNFGKCGFLCLVQVVFSNDDPKLSRRKIIRSTHLTITAHTMSSCCNPPTVDDGSATFIFSTLEKIKTLNYFCRIFHFPYIPNLK